MGREPSGVGNGGQKLVSESSQNLPSCSQKSPVAFQLCVTKQWDGLCAVKATSSWALEGEEDSPCSHHILAGADLWGGQLLGVPEGGRGWLRGTGTQRHVHCAARADRWVCGSHQCGAPWRPPIPTLAEGLLLSWSFQGPHPIRLGLDTSCSAYVPTCDSLCHLPASLCWGALPIPLDPSSCSCSHCESG